MVYNFDQYLDKSKVTESILSTESDAKKFRIVADFLKTSVSLVTSKGDNLFIAATPLGDKLVACFSESDILNIHESHLEKLLQEAYHNLQNNEYSYDSKKEFLVDIIDVVGEELNFKPGIWQDFFFIPNDNTNLKYKTTVSNDTSSECIVKIIDNIAKLYKIKPINFKTSEVSMALKNAINLSITAEDSVNYALMRVHVGWELQESNAFEGYKIYFPK